MNVMDTISTRVCFVLNFFIHFLLLSALKDLVKYDFNLIYLSVNYMVYHLCLMKVP